MVMVLVMGDIALVMACAGATAQHTDGGVWDFPHIDFRQEESNLPQFKNITLVSS